MQSSFRLGFPWLLLLTLVLAALPSHGTPLLLNGAFTAGTPYSPVTTVAHGSGPSAASSWAQWAWVPGSTITTTIVDDALLTGVYDLHVVTDNGAWPPDQMGNGIGQALTYLPTSAVVSFDILVVSGQVTGGLAWTDGVVGPFAPNVGTFNTANAGSWLHFVETVDTPGWYPAAVDFESLLTGTGADYYLRDIHVDAVPEPSSWFLLGIGLAGFANLVRKRVLRY